MTKQTLSTFIFNATSKIYDITTELYEKLYPNGQVVTQLDEKLLSVFRRYMAGVRVEIDSIREAIKEYENK